MMATTAPSFCKYCSSVLDLPNVDSIICTSCKARSQYKDLASLRTVTYSQDEPAPMWLTMDTKDNVDAETGPSRATVEEACPKCNHPEMEFYTMQLRSADEGQTVFYECKKCGHKFSLNT